MRAAVIQFPGSNCDRDMAVALNKFCSEKKPAQMVWHKESGLPKNLDLVAIPGGFSFGDYLRCGAIAARSPIMHAVIDFAKKGGFVLGVCNGFQVLTESGLLPGALMRNSNLKFVCKILFDLNQYFVRVIEKCFVFEVQYGRWSFVELKTLFLVLNPKNKLFRWLFLDQIELEYPYKILNHNVLLVCSPEQ